MHGTPERPPLISVAMVSAAALGYEVLLMRLFSIIQWHHFAYMVISLALLGYGASGTFIALARKFLLDRYKPAYWYSLVLFGLASVACYLAAQRVPFNAEEVLWDPQQSLYLLAIFLLLSLPFFFAASAIALTFSRHPGAIGRIYAADLLGAGLGSLMLVLLLFAMFPETALKYLGALGLGAAWVASRELRMTHLRWQVVALLGALGLAALPGSWLEPQISPYKGLSQALRITGTQVIEQQSSPLGVLAVMSSDTIPLRHAPGLSLRAGGTPLPEQLALFTDADAMSVINGNPRSEPLEYLDQLTSALPYHLTDLQRVVVLGTGGGSGIQQALNHQVPNIDAVEVNPQVVELVRENYGDWAGDLYDHDAVEVHVIDARGFIKRSRQRYDLVQISLLDSFGAASAGLHALNESYLYTVEALQNYLDHLAPDGYLAISRWIKLPPRDTLKLFATAVQALKNRGNIRPGEQLVLVRGWQTSTLLVKNSPFTASEIAILQRFCEERAFDVAWYPGMPAGEANRYNLLKEPWFFQAASALTGSDPAAFTEAYKFDITPATDDRPYFSHFFQWEVLPELLALRGQGGLPLLEAGYLVLVATLAIATVVSVVLVLLPLVVLRQEKNEPAGTVNSTRVVVYFLAIGLAFLFIEIACIQKFMLFLHHPIYAVATVLAAFLVFAGLGSAWAGRKLSQARPVVQPPSLAIAGIGVLSILYTLVLNPLFAYLVQLPMPGRVLVALLLLAPLAFCMGMPFPLGLAHIGNRRPSLIPWAWGINGCASVLSAVLATLLAIQFGFNAVILMAVLLYLLAAWMFP
ncbi:MAG: SAM-dependent methyltransferase [Gammaproteobacteria bacterium]|nr:MAG: SAM-dependent methyltransferase [Gammaproteobacteria bacterium]